MLFTPEFPDKELIIKLLENSNWNTKEQEEVFIQLQSLLFYYFRTEVINNERLNNF